MEYWSFNPRLTVEKGMGTCNSTNYALDNKNTKLPCGPVNQAKIILDNSSEPSDYGVDPQLSAC